MSIVALNSKQTLALALALLTCSIGGLLLTVQSISDTPAAKATLDQPLPIPAPAPALVNSTARLSLGNPVVTLDAENKQLLAQLDVHYLQEGKTLNGTINIAGQPRLDQVSKQFYLERPVIRQLTLASVSADRQHQIYQAINARLPDYFARQPVYAPLQTDALPVKTLEITLP